LIQQKGIAEKSTPTPKVEASAIEETKSIMDLINNNLGGLPIPSQKRPRWPSIPCKKVKSS